MKALGIELKQFVLKNNLLKKTSSKRLVTAFYAEIQEGYKIRHPKLENEVTLNEGSVGTPLFLTGGGFYCNIY